MSQINEAKTQYYQLPCRVTSALFELAKKTPGLHAEEPFQNTQWIGDRLFTDYPLDFSSINVRNAFNKIDLLKMLLPELTPDARQEFLVNSPFNNLLPSIKEEREKVGLAVQMLEQGEEDWFRPLEGLSFGL